MPIWNKTVRKLISVRYWAALGLIAALATASFIVTAGYVVAYWWQAEIIDIAARQRMYSQRIPFLAIELAEKNDEISRRQYRAALKSAVAGMTELHQVLSLREPQAMPERTRSMLRHVYYSDLRPFDTEMKFFLQDARALAEADNLEPGSPRLAAINRMGSSELLLTHQLVYNLLRTEARTALERFITVAAALWLLTLAVIAVEVPLFFRPMAGRTAETLRNLDAARRQAENDAAESRKRHEDSVTYMRLMNHELRTPLNAVVGMAALLRMSNLPEKQDEYARRIQESADHLSRLINFMLDFRELEADLVQLRKTHVSLKEELKRVCTVFHPLAAQKGLTLNCTTDERCAGPFLADGSRIRQVLSHLVNNALKFTEEGGVTVRAVLAGEAAGGHDLVRFEVIDTGIGVPPGLREQIFQEWHQAEGTLARKHGGLGLGLAIARRLVQLMDGEIGVESLEEKGSRFWFTLPLERAVSEEPERVSGE